MIGHREGGSTGLVGSVPFFDTKLCRSYARHFAILGEFSARRGFCGEIPFWIWRNSNSRAEGRGGGPRLDHTHNYKSHWDSKSPNSDKRRGRDHTQKHEWKQQILFPVSRGHCGASSSPSNLSSIVLRLSTGSRDTAPHWYQVAIAPGDTDAPGRGS